MTFQCFKNCRAECCGVVPIPKSTWNKHKNRIQRKINETFQVGDNIFAITDDATCAFLGVKIASCAIYPGRPLVCRLYGTLPELPCPYVDENGQERTEDECKKTQMKIEDMVDARLLQIQGSPNCWRYKQ